MFSLFTSNNKKKQSKVRMMQNKDNNKSATASTLKPAQTKINNSDLVSVTKNNKRALNETSPEIINQHLSRAAKKHVNEATRSRSPSIQTRIPNYWLNTTNRFEQLKDDVTDATIETSNKNDQKEEIPAKNNVPKPPPLFVHGVRQIAPLTEKLKETVETRFTLKNLNDYRVKIIVENKDDYQSVVKMLTEVHAEYHSFQLKDDKCFRVVMKGVQQSTDKEEITSELKELGHDVVNIAVMKSKRTGLELPMFAISLKTKDNNKAVFDIKRLANTVMSIEKPNKFDIEVPQCKRCQRFGHTKKYCHLGPRCVKCLEPHLTSECPRKNKDDKVKCINCQGDHPANYRGCSVYQSLRQKLQPALREKIHERRFNQEFINPNVSFANVLGDQTSKNVDKQDDMSELKAMMKELMSNMSTMLNLLTVVVSKLK